MGRVAIVTGGTRGIGAAISQALKEAGHTVIASYAGNDGAAAAFSEQTGITSRKWDAGNCQACAQAVEDITQQHGPIGILVNNAGITRDGMLHKMSEENWSAVITTNLNSVYNMTRPLIDSMRSESWGRIITISSINGL